LRAIWSDANADTQSNGYTYFDSDAHANSLSNTYCYARSNAQAAPDSAPSPDAVKEIVIGDE
jgi:hypothetical protein